MDDKTLQALTALAAKLGTTAEYLWSTLLRQATITSITTLLLLAPWVFLAVYFLRVVRRKTKQQAGDQCPKWENIDAHFAWAGSILFALVVGLVSCLVLSDTVTALVNPEYWALNKILSVLSNARH